MKNYEMILPLIGALHISKNTKEGHVTNYILSIEKLGHILSDPIFVSNLKVNDMPSRISFNPSMA